MSIDGATVLSRLAELAGASNTLTDPAQLSAYQIDGKSPAVVVRPESSEEVAAIVKFAAAENLAVVPCGARTKFGIGMPPRRYDLALDLTRMNRVVAYDPGDLTLSVEAGISLQQMARPLIEHRQFVPLVVPFMDRATAGGTIAAGVDSSLRQLYGTARDFVLGMEFVTGDGVPAKSGGRVVKNVAGYDIHKLMIGALGTLGVLTKINFRTFPLPRMTRTYLAVFRGPAAACQFRHALARSVLRPQGVEILAAGEESRQLGQRPPLSFGNDRWAVVVSFAGDEAILDRVRRELDSLAKSCAIESFAELHGEERDQVTRYVVDFFAAMLERSPTAAVFKISALPTDLAALANEIRPSEIPWAVMMRGLGVTYLGLLPPDRDADSLRRLRRECARIFGFSDRVPGTRSALLWCPSELKADVNVWGAPSADFALMQKLKTVFDPGGILSPGRFMGGL